LSAARNGDFEALLAVLDPDVRLRAESGRDRAAATGEVTGAQAVADLAVSFSSLARDSRPVLVNGAVGLITIREGRPVTVMGFTIESGRIVEIDILADPERLAQLNLAIDA
jgi:hypothetical protein